MFNCTMILECSSLMILRRQSPFPHLQVLGGHLTVVSMKYLPVHKDCLGWPTSYRAQMIARRVGSYSLSIKRKFPVVRKYKGRKRKN